MEQLHLPLHSSGDQIRKQLESETGKPVHLVLTDNSASMLSVRWKDACLAVRMHRIFLDAGSEVLDELADFIRKRNIRTPHIRNFINLNTSRLKTRPARNAVLRTQGKYHDLLDIFNSLNEEYFTGKISSSITWGRSNQKRAARKRTLGSYTHHSNLIRINPLLDTVKVPRYFLEFIVYHEMLHADLGIGNFRGRRSLHSREFREREKQFRDYEKALRWEQKRWG